MEFSSRLHVSYHDNSELFLHERLSNIALNYVNKCISFTQFRASCDAIFQDVSGYEQCKLVSWLEDTYSIEYYQRKSGVLLIWFV